MQELLQVERPVKKRFTAFGLAAVISFLLLLPFVILELLFNTVNRQNALGLFVLFGLLWLLSAAFIVILVPVVQALRAGNSVMVSPISLLFRVVFLALIGFIWGSVLIDQLPCFLGVPNCD